MYNPDPVELVATTIRHLAEAVAVVLFIAAAAVIAALLSGVVPA